MLEIKENNIFFSGQQLDTSKVDMEVFLMANLSIPFRVAPDQKFEEVMHLLFKAKKFINAYFSVEYSAINSLVTMGRLVYPTKHIRVYKSIERDEDTGVVYMMPQVQLITAKQGEEASDKVADLTFEFDFDLEDTDKVFDQKSVMNPKSEIFLIDFLTVIFDDIAHALMHENLLK